MSKEADIKVVKIQTCVLKVYIHCDGCKREVKKLLRKIEGVFDIKIDAEQGKVTVEGNVNPNTLIKKLRENRKHAELWPSKGGNPQLNKELQNLQIDIGEGPKGGKPQKGGKDLKGQQQQQQQQQQLLQKIKGMKLPQLKDLKLPTKTPKSVKFNLPDDDGDVTDDGCDDDYDDDDMDDGGYDDDDFDPNEVKAHLKKAAMNQQNPPMGAPKNGKKGGAGDVQVQNKAMVGNTDAKDGNGGKKGGQSQGGGARVAKNGGKNGGAQDHKNGGTGNNKVATNGTNGGNNSAASGVKKGGGGSTNDHMGHTLPNNMSHGFHGMNPSGGGANLGQMGNMPMGQMGNIPVQGLPTMNAGGYFQGAGPEFPAGNPYNQQQQQYIAAMMQQQRQNGMYARPPPYPVSYMPHPPAGESFTNLFSDENPNGCMIM